MSGTETARLVRARELSAREVAESHIDRINDVNERLNAIVLRTDDDARECAARVDADPSGSLAGVAITTKINTDHAPYPTTNGIKALRDNIATRVHPCVEGLLDNGGLMLGRTNSPAFAMRAHTENELHGETLNPHRIEISSGGSSGGAAVAVAAGMCQIAQGNDVAGSVRWPAHQNGVIGLRPTIGRIPSGGTNPNPRGWSAANMSTNGPMARTMADIEAGYVAMRDANWLAEPNWVPARSDFTAPSRLRVAVILDDGRHMDPIVRATVRRSADILAAAGHDVVEAAPPLLDEFFTLWKRLGALDMILGLVAMLPAIDDAGLTTAWNNWKDSFPPVTGEMFLKALQERDMVMRAWTSFLVEHDVFVTPLMTMTTIPRRGDIATESAMNEFDETGRWGINLSAIALPVLAFPVGSHEGTPLGVQIAARAWREDLLLAAGRDLERSIGEVQPVHVQW
ncbi:MAG: indoleacetamide hydrolase [Actinomycetota bacterium]